MMESKQKQKQMTLCKWISFLIDCARTHKSYPCTFGMKTKHHDLGGRTTIHVCRKTPRVQKVSFT